MRSLEKYLQSSEYVLRKISFDYEGGRYSGRGIMRWHSDKGFDIEAPLERTGPALRSIGFGGLGVIRKSEVKTIRMQPWELHGGASDAWIIAPDVVLTDRFDVTLEKRISIRVGRAIFSQRRVNREEDGSLWRGEALYRVSGNPILPDSVTTKTSFGSLAEMNRSRAAISVMEPDGISMDGMLIDKKYLWINYQLPRSFYSRTTAWRWPEALRDALSISLGQVVQLLRREIDRGSRQYIEMRRNVEPHQLGVFSPLGFSSPLLSDHFVPLTRFMAAGGHEADVCINIFRQLVEATQQKSWQARSLLLATILEAALRTLQQRPFGKKLKVERALDEFRDQYLGSGWKEACRRAKITFFKLRDRNAHPDWLHTAGGMLTDEVREEIFWDLVFMCQFYGYMILALAGVNGSAPEFQEP